jgi:hypothetical protein
MTQARHWDAKASQKARIEELEADLQKRLTGRVTGLHIIPQDRGLILRGRSLSYYSKQVAQHALMAATDLPIVANEIEVGLAENPALSQVY